MTSRSKAKNVTRKEKEKETETPAPPNSPSYMATKIPRTQKIEDDRFFQGESAEALPTCS